MGRRTLGGGAAGVTANRPGRTGLFYGSCELPRIAGLGHKGLEFALLAPRDVVVVVVAVAQDSARRRGGRVLHRATLSLA
jgi:hypothetical protein